MIRLFLLRFLETYFRHRWLYLLPIVIVACAAVAHFLTTKPTYSTRGVLYVNDTSLLTSLTAIQNNETNWWTTPAQATTNEINELLQTDAFVRAIIKETDLEEYMDDGHALVSELIAGVRRQIKVNPAGNNQLIINATSENPENSYQLVRAVINSYLFWQINTERQDSQVAQEFFRDLIKNYTAELEKARQALADYYDTHPAPLSVAERLVIDQLQNQNDLAAARLNNALEKEENANLAIAQLESDVRQTYVLVDAPRVPDRPDLSNRKLAIQSATFFGVGVILSLAAVLGATVLDRSFRFPMDVENFLHLPVLAVTPFVATKKKWYQRIVPDFLKGKKNISAKDNRNQLEDPETPDYGQVAVDLDKAYQSKDVRIST